MANAAQLSLLFIKPYANIDNQIILKKMLLSSCKLIYVTKVILKKKKENIILHGYVVPSRIDTFAWTTPQPEFIVYYGKYKYVIHKIW